MRSNYGFKQDKYSIPKKKLRLVSPPPPRSYRVTVSLLSVVGQTTRIVAGSAWACQISSDSCEVTANETLYTGSHVTMKLSWDQLSKATVEGRVVSSTALPTTSCIRDENGAVKKLHKVKIVFSESSKDRITAFIAAADEVANSNEL